MRNNAQHTFLSILLILPILAPNLGGLTGGGVPYYSLLKDALERNFEPNKGIPEVVDTRDPVILAQIEQLAFCESSGQEDIKIVDTNGWHSYGCLQFQFPTFKQYCKRYGIFPEAEDDELLNVIGDCAVQKDLAYRMIQESPEAFAHWAVCSKRLGYL